MKKINKSVIGLVIILSGVVMLIAYFMQNSNRHEALSITQGGGGDAPTPSNEVFPLRIGSRGKEVRQLQTALSRLISYRSFGKPFYFKNKWQNSIKIDGIFGLETLSAVKWYLGNTANRVTEADYQVILKDR